MAANPLRQLPSVDALLAGATELVATYGRPATVGAIRAALAQARAAGEAWTAERLLARAAELLGRPPSLRPVLNATGVIVAHEPRPRAPGRPGARAGRRAVASGYANLEYDLDAGARGSRHHHLGALLRRADRRRGRPGREQQRGRRAALPGRRWPPAGEVLISRGELIEIGDGFRIPDILAQSGARLVEVGTTNRTALRRLRARDRPRAPRRSCACTSRTSAWSASPRAPGLGELAELAPERGVTLIDDLGSGQLLDLPDLADEPTARSSVAAGAHGRLLLGRQAARRPAGGRDRRHGRGRGARPPPSAGTGAAHRQALAGRAGGDARALPRPAAGAARGARCWRRPPSRAEAVRARAERLAARLGGDVVDTTARIGGGAVPLLELPSFACALDGGETLRARPASGRPAGVARVHEGRVLLDCRTLSDERVPADHASDARHRRPHRPRQDGAGRGARPASTPTACRRRRRAASRSSSATRRSSCRPAGSCRWSTCPGTSGSCARWWPGATGIDLFLLVVAATTA